MTTPHGWGRPADDRPSWARITPPMRAVDDVRTGVSETYWRSDNAAGERARGQRWGMPAAAVVLVCNLVAFSVLPFVISTQNPAVFVPATMAPTVIAAAAVLGISRSRGSGPVIDFGLPRRSGEWFYQLRTGVGWGLVSVVLSLTVALLLVAARGVTPIGLDGSPPLSLGWRIAFAAWVIVGAPLGEELMFRGLLWGALEKRRDRDPHWSRWLGNRWVVLVVTAVLFAAWHREPDRFPVLLCGGLVLGVARLRSGSIAASATAHAVNNTLVGLAVVFAPMAMA